MTAVFRAGDGFAFILLSLLQSVFVFLSLFGTAAFFRRRGFGPSAAVGAGLAAVAVCSLAVFWLTMCLLPGHGAGRIVTVLAILALAVLAIAAFYFGQWGDEIALPIALSFAATMALLLWAHAGSNPASPLEMAAGRWTHPLPCDNALPLQFARSIADGAVPVGQPNAYFGDWLASDRPPLQTAMFLLTPGYLVLGASEQAYQPTGVALQMFALLGVWALVRSLGGSRPVALASMLTVFFTPLVLVNGAFVWPKLLAAAFLLFAAAVHFSPLYEDVKHTGWYGVLVGAFAGLAALSHGGSAFALMGMALAALIIGRWGTLRYSCASLVAVVLICSPWFAYQHYVNPPGDRLLKWHLAGVVPIDSRPLGRALKDSYREHTWSELLSARRRNLKLVLDPASAVWSDTLKAARHVIRRDIPGAASQLKGVRITQFFMPIAGTGILGFFLYLLPLGLLDSRVRALTLAVLLSLAAWIVLMFLPGSTQIHQGSLFPEIAVIALAVVGVARRSAWFVVALMITHIAVTAFQYGIG